MKRKVLHIVSKLDPGGIEKWILGLQSVESRYEHYILSISGVEGSWASLVSAPFHLLKPNIKSGRIKFLRELREVARSGDFDIIHSHLYRFSCVLLSFLLGTPVKCVAHAHNDLRHLSSSRSWLGQIVGALIRTVCHVLFLSIRCGRLAASHDAAADLFGFNSATVLHCGVPMVVLDRDDGLSEPKGELVLVTVGSLTEQKNHRFLLRVAAELNRVGVGFVVYIIGDGPLRTELEAEISRLKLERNVKLLGIRDDVLAFLQKEADVFLFPSLHEGLGLALIEAQSVGLPCYISNRVPSEADVASCNVHRLPLEVEDWVRALAAASPAQRCQRLRANRELLASDFNLPVSAQRLESFYDEICG